MRSLILITLMVLAASVASAKFGPKWHELEAYTFDRYVSDYGLSYSRGSNEWKTRQENFNKRLDSIRAHNKDTTQTYKRGVNQFADWSDAEFHEYNRARFVAPEKPVYRQNVAKSIDDLPKTVDYRTANPPVLTAIKNQAACGNCYAHSTIESMESYFAIKTGQLPVLSTQQVTSCALTDGCGGGSYLAGWDYVSQSEGLNEEWVYPFTDFFCDPPLSSACTSPCKNISKMFTKQFKWWPKANVSGYVQPTPNDALSMMDAIANEGPQSIGVASDPWADYESGILQNNYTDAASNMTWQTINHAVQMVGYGYDFDLNENYWVVRNSWGTNYGENGYIRLLRPKVEPCGNVGNFGTVCGTSGVLCYPAYPKVTELKKKNSFYF